VKSIRWQDWIDILLGLWLVVSPWQMDYTLHHAATGNACGVGAVLIMFNLISVGRLLEQGQEIVNILLGGWLILSPYALDFASQREPTVNVMVVGATVICLAVWQMIDAVRIGKE
jgi:hypothetical protein